MEESITESKKTNKTKRGLLIAIGAVLVAGIVVLILFISGVFGNREKQANGYMESLASEFYTELFYAQLEEGRTQEELVEFLQKYEETGIKVSLDNLSRTAGEENQAKIETLLSDDFKCDREETRASVFPIAPFGKDNYTIEVELQCEL